MLSFSSVEEKDAIKVSSYTITNYSYYVSQMKFRGYLSKESVGVISK